MKNSIKLAVIGALLAAGVAQTNAQSNKVDYWVQPLNVSLTGFTNVVSTNGNIVTGKTLPVRLNSKDIIKLLSNKGAYKVTTGSETNTVTVGTNQTKYVKAVPTYARVTNSYSATAKLLFIGGLGTNDVTHQHVSDMWVIRDGTGTSTTDYDVSEYFDSWTWNTRNTGQDVRLNSGKKDLATGKVTGSSYSIEEMEFDSAGWSGTNSTAIDVVGFAKENVSALLERQKLVDGGPTRSFSASVAGTGRFGNDLAPSTLRGTISTSGGKHEVK